MLKNIKIKSLILLSLTTFLVAGCSEKEEPKKEETKTEKVVKEVDETEEIEKQEEAAKELEQAGESLKESEYVEFTREMGSNMSAHFKDFARLTSEDFEYSNDWIQEMALVLTLIKYEAETVIDYDNVPNSFKEAHNVQMKAMNKYINFTDLFARSVDSNFDEALLEEAKANMNEGNQLIGEATALILEMQ